MLAQVQFEASYRGWAEDHLMQKSGHGTSPSSQGVENPMFARMKERIRS